MSSPMCLREVWSMPLPTSKNPSPTKWMRRTCMVGLSIFLSAMKKWAAELDLGSRLMTHLETHIKRLRKELDDDAKSIITNQRYAYISKVVDRCVKKEGGQTQHDGFRQDRPYRNKPRSGAADFAVVMYLVYWIAMGPFGSFLTDWTNDVFAAEWLQGGAAALLEGWGVDGGWLHGPYRRRHHRRCGRGAGLCAQMLVLFDALRSGGHRLHGPTCILFWTVFSCKFGLSGKSFIPMLIGSGCGVPLCYGVPHH